MAIFIELYRSLQNRRFGYALRNRDIQVLAALAHEGGLRLAPDQALIAARLLMDDERTCAAMALLQNALLGAPGHKRLLSGLREAGERIAGASVARRSEAEELASRGDTARDSGDQRTAAAFYGEALALAPEAAHWRVQRANMLKDSGEIAAAELEYRRAQLDRPDDADIPLQLGRTLKIAGRPEEARESFREALRRDPANRAARDEIAWLGETGDHVQQSLAALERGEPFALFAIADAMTELRDRFARIEELLPSASAGSAFPIELHDLFRRIWTAPAPPHSAKLSRLAILFDADAGNDRTFHARLDAIAALAGLNILPVATVTDTSRRDEIMRRAAPDAGWPLLCLAEPTLHGLTALLEEQGCDGLFILDGETVPDPVAPSWFAFALARAEAAYADGESGHLSPNGRIARYAPVLRAPYDRHAIASDGFGCALALRRTVLAEIGATQPSLPPTATALSTAVAARAMPLHIPLFLTCDLGETSLSGADSLPLELHNAVPVVIGCVIPTRDYAEDAERFVRSLRETARYPEALAVLVVDNGVQGDGLAALKRLSRDGVTVVRNNEAFNWSRLNNCAVAELRGADILLFANDDMEMLTQHWDVELRAVLALEGVGALGAKLLYPDRTIQHAGMLCSWAGRPEHEGRGEPEDAAGPAGRWRRRRSALAVTGAFLATNRTDFEALGGFDPKFPLGLNDVDFCLRLREHGRDTVFTPHITLIHHESKTRGRLAAGAAQAARAAAEDARFAARWPSCLGLDPTVNPNWCEAFSPFRAYRGPTSAAVLRHLDQQLAIGDGVSGSPQ